MANQIFELRTVAATNVDSFIKTGIADFELRNGDIVEIGKKNEKDKWIFTLTKPTAETKNFGIVYNAGVQEIEGYRIGGGNDPRKVAFKAGTPVNVYLPQKGDEVAYTEVEGTASGATYLVPTDGKTIPSYTSEAPEGGLGFEITGTHFITVGDERVPTVEAIIR